MTKLTEICLKQKNSFIPRYGHNKAQKNGRRMETNAPTLGSIVRDEENKMKKLQNKGPSLNCQNEINEFINCLKQNGKDKISVCSQQAGHLSNCYKSYYNDDNLAFKVYNTQIDLMLKDLN